MASPDDVISVLTHDHREVQDIFDRLRSASEAEDKRRLADEVTIELIRHSVAEEEYLYPATRKFVPDGDALADRELDDHAEVEKLLKRLEKTDVTDPEFDRLVTSLVSDVMAHVQDEESTLFPQLAEHAHEEELTELGEKVRSAKAKAPTRPHPAAPDTPPLNKLLAPGAGLVDRVRDHLTGRGRT